MPGHDNDWTVSTLKQYMEALRGEDQKAVRLLAEDVRIRLDHIDTRLADVKQSVERFHASFAGREKEGSVIWLRIFNIATIVMAIAVLLVTMFVQHVHLQ